MALAPTPSAFSVRLLLTLLSVTGVCLAREHVFLNRLHEVLETSDTGIDSVCREDTAVYLEQLRLGAPWALKMFDSSAKPHSGVLEGGLTFLGLYSECLEALPEGATAPNLSVAQQFHSRYCLATLNLHDAQEEAPEGFPEYLWQELRANPWPPQFGLCVPSSCSPEDVTSMVGQFAKGFVDGAKATGSSCSSPREPFFENVGALVVSAVLLAFALLVAVGTAYDLCYSYQGGRKKPSSFQSVETKVASSEGLVDDEDQKGSQLGRVLLCFSLVANCTKIMNTSSSNKEFIQIIHGLRFISMSWIILGHSYASGMTMLTFRNTISATKVPQDPISQAVANGTLTVDTFFFISGLLVVYVSLKVMSEMGGKLHLCIFYSHRYWRMTPLMMAVIGISATLLPYFGDGPRWHEIVAKESDTCKANWWVNAIYLQNFINTPQMCLGHTWFSAVDIQIFLIAPLIIYPLYRTPRWGVALIFVLLLASFSTTAALTVINDFPAMPYVTLSLFSVEKRNAYMNDVYIKPYCRIGPSLIGMLMGYVLHVTKGSIVFRKSYVWLGWAMCSFLMLGVLYAMWPANAGTGVPPVAWAAAYSAMGRTLWAVGLSWIVLASLAGYGGIVARLLSWSAMVPLSRLTYSAYIVHPLVIATFYGSQQGVLDYSEYMLAYFSMGNLCISYTAALVFSMVFEAPVMAMEKVFLGRK